MRPLVEVNQTEWKLDAVLKILENLGHDVKCGACMEIAFTSQTTNLHSCKLLGPKISPPKELWIQVSKDTSYVFYSKPETCNILIDQDESCRKTLIERNCHLVCPKHAYTYIFRYKFAGE